MSSLPVKTLYQRIGEQVEAQPNAVVHIENSIYLRSKAISSDKDALHEYINYAISNGQYASVKYDLQIKQNNNGVQYAIATFVIPQIARDLIEEHPPYFHDELIHITSAYLQPRRNGGGNQGRRFSHARNQQQQQQPKRTNRWDSSSSSGSSYHHSMPPVVQSKPAYYSPPSSESSSPIYRPVPPPPAPPVQPVYQPVKPVFHKDVQHLAEKLKHISIEPPKPKADNLLMLDSLLDSGNCSPNEDQRILYPFGLCLPDYRSYKTISRCASFSKSKDELLFDTFQQCNDYPKFY